MSPKDPVVGSAGDHLEAVRVEQGLEVAQLGERLDTEEGRDLRIAVHQREVDRSGDRELGALDVDRDEIGAAPGQVLGM